MFWRRELSDAEVVRRVLGGRRELFGVLVERYMPTVHAIAYARVGRRADAEDVAQEAFLRSLQALPSLQDPDRFGAWVSGIARNVASVATRSAVRRENLHQRLDTPATLEPLRTMERNEMHELLRAQVMALDEGPREILLLHYFAEKNVREIASALDITVEAAKKRLQRARELLSANVMNELGPAFAGDRPSTHCMTKIIAATAAANVAWQSAAASASAATTGMVGWTTIGGAIAVKKTALVVVLAAIAAGGIWVSTHDSPAKPQSRVTTPAQSAPNVKDRTEIARADESAAPLQETAHADAPDSETSPDSATTGFGTIAGTVKGANDRLAANATVTLYPVDTDSGTRKPLQTSLTTDGQGAFEFKGLPFESFAVVAEAKGTFGVATARLNWDRPEATVTIALKQGGTIAGWVRDREGNPVEGAHVFPLERVATDAWPDRYFAMAMQAVSGPDGAFVLAGLQEPTWKLCATAEGYATSRTEAVTVGMQHLEITMSKGSTVAGQVVMAETGAAVSNADLSLEMRWPDSAECASGADGTFEFSGIGEGEYIIEVDKETLVPVDAPVRVQVADGQDVSGVLIVLAEGGVITGRLYDTVTNEGLLGLTVHARGKGSPEREGMSDAQGIYRIEGLVGGSYNLSADRPDGYLDPGYANEKVVDAKLGAVVEGVDFAMQKGTSITGRVVDEGGKPVANARVDVSPASWHVTATTDEEGHFELSPLEPSNALYIGAHSDTQSCNPQGPFRLAAEGLHDVEIVIGPSGSIAGKLVNSKGTPVADMKLFAWPAKSPGGFALPTATTTGAGEFSIAGLPANTYRMVASPPGSSSIANNELDRVELAVGEQIAGLVLVYDDDAGLAISGRVTDSEGNAVSGETVECVGPVSGAAVTDAEGMYEATRLSEGVYYVSVRGQSGTAQRGGVVAGSEGVDLVIPGHGELVLTVVSRETGAPITDFEYMVRGGAMQDIEPFYLDHELHPARDPNGVVTTEAPIGEVTVFGRAHGYMLSSTLAVVGPEGSAEAVLELTPASTLDLLVTDAGGTPIAGAEAYLGEIEVYDKPSNRSAFSIGVTDQSGRLVYDMLDPSYTSVYVAHPKYAPASAPTTSGAPVEVVLQGGGIVEGIVTQDGEPVSPELCMVGVSYPDNPGLGKTAVRVEAFPYHIEGVVPGTVLVEASVMQQEPNYSSHSVFQEVVVAAGELTAVNIDVPAWDATIEGRVHQGGLATVQGVVKATMVTADGREEQFTAYTDETGAFVIPQVPSGTGTIDVLLWEHWVDPASRRRLGPEPITTRAGETTTVDFNFAE